MKGVIPGRQFPAQILKVVDFAVIDQDRTALGRLHGLAAAGQIDDAQTTHAQAQTVLHIGPPVVRSAMPDVVEHGFHDVFDRFGLDIRGDEAHYAAHEDTPGDSRIA